MVSRALLNTNGRGRAPGSRDAFTEVTSARTGTILRSGGEEKGPRNAVKPNSSEVAHAGDALDDAPLDQQVVAVAATLNAQLGDITHSMRSLLADRIEELRGDQRIIELLGSSIEGNVDTILHLLQHDIAAQQVDPPAAAVEYARRLAQRGVPVNALVRAYRIGQDHFLKWSFAEIERQIDDGRIAFHACQRFVSVTFGYIDWISQQIVTVYEAERERWLENRSTVRATRIREIIDGQDIDPDTAEAAIGHLLRQTHVAVILWAPSDGAGATADLTQLEHTVSALARALGCTGRPLFAACDRSSGWGWLPFGRTQPAVDATAAERVLDAAGTEVMLAFGRPAAGIRGFRESHQQALRAQRVALVAGPRAPSVISYTDPGVRAAAMMCGDLDEARLMVRTTLGRLAIDSPHHERLRHTLLQFISASCSYTAAAEALTMHKNSVKYRVAKAQEERGRPIDEDRLDVELALNACRWLGPSMLIPPD